jgi:hypothetical protein
MRLTYFAGLFAVIAVTAVPTLASDPILEVGSNQSITGPQLRALQTAIQAIEQSSGKPLDLVEYDFVILGGSNEIGIGVSDIKRPPNMLGITGRVPEYDVRMTRDGLHVLSVRLVDD